MPWFIARNGPVREARFVQSNGCPDGGVHDLFVITGGRMRAAATSRSRASCRRAIRSPGWAATATWCFASRRRSSGRADRGDSRLGHSRQRPFQGTRPSSALGVFGHPNANLGGNVNRSANDGTITRFGWKAQNKSLLMFAGEAYNVEMGISNELFPQERDETLELPGRHRRPRTTPLNIPNPADPPSRDRGALGHRGVCDVHAHAGPTAAGAHRRPSTQHGSCVFASIGCALCHTPAHDTAARPHDGAGLPNERRCPVSSRCRCTRTCWCITWVSGSRMASPRARRARMSSAPRRCGASGSGCSSCTTGAPAT